MTKCDFCKEKPVAHLKYAGQHLCKEHFCALTEERFRITTGNNRLFQYGDKVAIAAAGDSSSIVLLHLLKGLGEKMNLDLHGVLVDEGSKKGLEIAEKILKKLGVPYKKKEKGKLLNKAALSIKADKLATAQTLDDEALETLMRYLEGDYKGISGMEIKTRGAVPQVKPLRNLPEEEVVLYARLQGYKCHDANPKNKDELRAKIKTQLDKMEKTHPGTKFQIVKGADNLREMLEKK